MSGSRGNGGRRVAGTHRSTVAALVVGSLAVQLALAPSLGAAVAHEAAETGPVPVASSSPHVAHGSDPSPDGESAGTPSALAVAAPPGQPASSPPPCGGAGRCGWGLMTCDGAGTCLPLQILPSDPAAVGGSGAGLAPGVRSLIAPTHGTRSPEGPPPRA